MSIVVSDTSPIRALDHIGCLPLLVDFFGRVLIPVAVARELAAPRRDFRAIQVADHPFLEVIDATDRGRVDDLRKSLDLGEAEAIALACEVNADAILIDERRGRAAAGRFGLTIIGTMGLLVRAKREQKIAAVRPLLDALMDELEFFVAADLRIEILRQAGETP